MKIILLKKQNTINNNNNKLMKRVLSISLLMATLFGANAQKDTAAHVATPPPIAITGSVDAYYRYNFSGATNNYTSFTNSQNSFELGMASIRGDHSFGKGGVTVDLGFGRRAAEYSYNDTANKNNLFALKQVYVTYQAGSKVKFTLGKWGTHIGYEVLDAYSNRNYSMDYMFSFGPFFHTGLKADIALDSSWSLMLGVANPTDFSSTTSATKVAIAQLGYTTKDAKWKGYLNYQGYYGVATPYLLSSVTGYGLNKNLSQIDLVVNGTLNSKWGIGYNGTWQGINDGNAKSWWGSAVYLNFDPKTTLGFTLRGEYISDKDGIKFNPSAFNTVTVVGADVYDLTLSTIWKIDNCLTIIPEIRYDNASKEGIFWKSGDVATQNTFSGLIAAVYKF